MIRKKKTEAAWAEAFGKMLRKNRLHIDISQWDLSIRLGIRETMYQSFESGRVLPSLPKAWMLMNYFQLDPTETFEEIAQKAEELLDEQEQ